MKSIISAAISAVVSIAVLFFGTIGVISLVMKLDYVSTLNLAFDWIKGLSAK